MTNKTSITSSYCNTRPTLGNWGKLPPSGARPCWSAAIKCSTHCSQVPLLYDRLRQNTGALLWRKHYFVINVNCSLLNNDLSCSEVFFSGIFHFIHFNALWLWQTQILCSDAESALAHFMFVVVCSGHQKNKEKWRHISCFFFSFYIPTIEG